MKKFEGIEFIDYIGKHHFYDDVLFEDKYVEKFIVNTKKEQNVVMRLYPGVTADYIKERVPNEKVLLSMIRKNGYLYES